jgi:transcriptional regulator with PAS, ATPase and Fis domain
MWMAGPPSEHDATEVEARLELNLTALRNRPRLEWADAAGSHSIEIEGRVLLGSSSHLPLSIADRAVSRLHAELEVKNDGVWIRDLGSRNGTWVDGVLVQSARLPGHGRLKVGSTTLTVSLSGEATAVPLWPHDRFGPLLARSEVMRELFLRLSQYAETESPVLIQGETGTGKELVAQAVHDMSTRAEGPFIVVDCAALPETLLESELFGHAKGSFTGAERARAGAFEAADGGTVFLDEIGELPLAMQPKLLRILESQTLRRLGETEHRRVDVRFVSATNRDLQSMVGNGSFREDLYFRLAVLPVFIPALRARADDIPLLLEHFLKKKPGLQIDHDLRAELAIHRWVGNVRELRSFAERAIAVGPQVAWAMTRGADVPTRLPPPPSIAPGLPSVPPSQRAPASLGAPPPPSQSTYEPGSSALPAVSTDVPFKELRERWVDHLEREYMAALLRTHGRDVGAIADAAQLDRSYVHRLLRKHEL